MNAFDQECMTLALKEAARARGHTGPNPCVGAVIAVNGKVVAVGHHLRAGAPHAEVAAMNAARDAGVDLGGATVYVTLEPCAHHGRTGPCAVALVEARVQRVVYGCVDPNPKVSGRGLAILRKSKVVVDGPLLEPECRELIADFVMGLTRERPYVIAKSAMSVDGHIATASGESQWITGEAARADGRRLRGQVQAIIAGRGTVVADDPQLTARLVGAPEPLRVVFDAKLKLPKNARVLGEGSLVVTTRAASRAAEKRIRARGGEVWRVAGRPDVSKTLHRLYAERGFTRVLVEGGAKLLGSFAKADLIDEWWVYLAPKLLGGGTSAIDFPVLKLARAPQFRFHSVDPIGPDLRLILRRL